MSSFPSECRVCQASLAWANMKECDKLRKQKRFHGYMCSWCLHIAAKHMDDQDDGRIRTEDNEHQD